MKLIFKLLYIFDAGQTPQFLVISGLPSVFGKFSSDFKVTCFIQKLSLR